MKVRGPLITLAAVAVLGVGILTVNISQEPDPVVAGTPVAASTTPAPVRRLTTVTTVLVTTVSPWLNAPNAQLVALASCENTGTPEEPTASSCCRTPLTPSTIPSSSR